LVKGTLFVYITYGQKKTQIIMIDLFALRKEFEEFASLTEDEWKLIENKIKIISLKKGEFLLKAGEVCNILGLVLSGIYRVYWVSNTGKQRALYFYTPYTPISNYCSYIKQAPSHGTIECMSDGEIIYLTYEDNLILAD
jgi:CRP/FNR family transcriptional regulator, anaerobic regulatory protein